MKNKPLLSLLFFTLLYSILTQFYHLGKLPIVQWDESRLAVNAAEMAQSHNYFVTTFEQQPDLYNTKPPLMIWLQVLAIQCFGLNEWAIRLPSALAGLLTIWLVGVIIYRQTKSILATCFGMLMLTTCDGLIQLHGSITGDYDSLLVFFLVAALFQCLLYLDNGNRKNLMSFIVFVALSLLTKSAAAVLFFPVYMFCFFYIQGIKKMPVLFVSILIALIPFFVFVYLRESASNGYLKAMWANDFGGRFANGKDGHEGPWYYYIQHLFGFRFNWFIWCLVPAILWGFFKQNKTIITYSMVLFIYLFFISIAQTKLEWYDIPLLPLISIVIALTFFDILSNHKSRFLQWSIYLIIAVGLSHSLYQKMMFTSQQKGLRLSADIYTISEKIRHYNGSEILYYYSGTYDAWNYFYTLVNPHVKRVKYSAISVNDKMITVPSFSDSLKKHFIYQTLDSNQYDKTIRITGIKNH
ncbi:MAG: glycosyltransferase family 39 protein [bacterium]|nr:glycosyltransferase family 39 protein [bacterium]